MINADIDTKNKFVQDNNNNSPELSDEKQLCLSFAEKNAPNACQEQASGVIRSMTGFGVQDCCGEDFIVRLEIKSVNHRGLKIFIRSRPSLGTWERQFRDTITEQLKRGAVDVSVEVVRMRKRLTAGQIDVARNAIENLRCLGQDLDLPGEITVADLLRIPDLFSSAGESLITESEWILVHQALQQALKTVVEQRQLEGSNTTERLRELVQPIELFVNEARRRAGEYLPRIRSRLTERLKELLSQTVLTTPDMVALEREVVLLADKADVNEELDRLNSHLSQFRGILHDSADTGRRIDFIAQEMLREINTCVTKAGDSKVSALGIDAKLAVEKIKEQAANLE